MASKFVEVSKIAPRRQISKLCQSIACPKALNNPAVHHVKMYEQKIIKQLEERYQIKSQKLGLFYFTRQTYLGDYPDAIIGDDAIVDVKSPYAMEDLPISTGSKIKNVRV